MIAIEVKISKAGRLSDGTVKPLIANLTGAARVMAEALRKTAFAHTDRVTFDKKRRTYLSDEYMRLLGPRFSNKDSFRAFADQEKSQKKPILRLAEKGWSWKDSDTWHWLARKDDASFNRTGGMWAGLRVRNYGGKGAIIEFAGQSEGQTGVWRRGRGRRNTSKPVNWKLSKKVPNQLKAWTVYKEKNTLLVQPDAATQRSFEQGVLAFALRWVSGELGTKASVRVAGLDPLAVRFADELG